MRALLADVGPLRRNPAFRRLWIGQAVSSIGGQLVVVAVAFQAYKLTHSSLIVGLIGLVQLIPMLVGAIGGGTIADAHDRRRVLIVAQLMLMSSSGALAANAFLRHPTLWVLFVAASASATFQGLDWPTRNAVLPMLLPAEDIPSAYALQSIVTNLAMVLGPALGGLLIARFGLGVVYSTEVALLGASLLAAISLPRLAPAAGGTPVSLSSVVEGLRFLTSERLLSASMWLDLIAMSFGMPKAVFPALAVGLFKGGAGTVGLLYAAPGAGALIGSMLSGWIRHVRYQPRALVVCMVVWGVSIALFGVVPMLVVGLAMLAVAGAADVFGGVFRVSILQARTPAHMQGRLSGSFYAAAVAGNKLGDGETGVAAAIAGPQFAVWSGGLACLVATFLLVWRVPALWRPSDPDDEVGPVIARAVPASGEAG